MNWAASVVAHSWMRLSRAMDENTNEASIWFPSIVNVTKVTTAVITGIEKNIKRFTAIRRSVERIRSSSTARSAAIRSSIDCSNVYLSHPKVCENPSRNNGCTYLFNGTHNLTTRIPRTASLVCLTRSSVWCNCVVRSLCRRIIIRLLIAKETTSTTMPDSALTPSMLMSKVIATVKYTGTSHIEIANQPNSWKRFASLLIKLTICPTEELCLASFDSRSAF